MPSALEAYPLSQHYRDRSLRDERHVRSSGNVPDEYTGKHVRATRGVTGKMNVNGDLQVKNLGNMRAGQTAYDTGIGWFFGYDGDTPVFSIGDSSPGAPKMLWDGSTLTIVGNITATTGEIGGWTIGTTQLTGGDTALDSAGVIKVGTGDNIAQLSSVDSTYRLWAGNASPSSAPFRVTQTGALTASGATIDGTLTADAGTIGGWNISSTGFGSNDVSLNSAGNVQVGSGNNIVILDSQHATYRLWVGNATAGSAPFRVTQAGAMTAESGDIGGWTINGTSGIQLGSTSNTRGLSTGTWAFFAGNSSPGSAPFRVRTDGLARFSDIDVVGGSIDGSVLNVGTVNADRLNVSTLSAITADMGTITAGSITAGSIDVGTLDAGTINFQSNGTLGSGAGYSGTIGDTGGGLSLGSLSVADTISIGSGGRIEDADGSYWDQDGIVLRSGGSFGDVIAWQAFDSDISSWVNIGAIYGWVISGSRRLLVDALENLSMSASDGEVRITATNDEARMRVADAFGSETGSVRVDSSGRTIASGNIFPGDQINDFLTHDGTDIGFSGLRTAPSAGSVWNYIYMTINGLTKKIAVYDV